MTMNKGDYQNVAGVIQESDLDDAQARQLAIQLADKFASGNPRFNPLVFVAQAIGKDRLDEDDIHDVRSFSAGLDLRVGEILPSFTWR